MRYSPVDHPTMGSELYEVLIRNPEAIDIHPTIVAVKNFKITSGQLIFEGIKLEKDSGRTDKVTFAKKLKDTDYIEILPGTHGAFRVAPETPEGDYRASFTVHKADDTNGIKYEWPLPPNLLPANGKPHQIFLDSPLSITAEHRIHKVQFQDVLVIGSGPLGATYSRKLIDANKGYKVLMVEAGAQENKVIGRHKKNTMAHQLGVDNFVHVIKGNLSPLSVPVKHKHIPTLNPTSWRSSEISTRNGQNPNQAEHNNLRAAAVTRCVGGMSTLWTCSTPRQLKGVERWDDDGDFGGLSDHQWEALYKEAEEYLGTSSEEFESSIRQQLVKEKLAEVLNSQFSGQGREVKPLPLACKRSSANLDFVAWAATDTVLGDVVHDPNFRLASDHLCRKVLHDSSSKRIIVAEVENLEERQKIYVFAKHYIVCGGAILTPQLLFNSGFRPTRNSLPALGHYMTGHTVTFCQIILKREVISKAENDPRWEDKVKAHKSKHPEDHIPFPLDDPDLHITIPVSKNYPWHTQIHRDAFPHGDISGNIDSRLIVDFRFLGMVEPKHHNCVEFSTEIHDRFHMPQPTFKFVLGEEDKRSRQKMMEDMCTLASQIGDYLPGSEPQFLEPGLHICGTTRAGKDKTESVVNNESKVWGVDNLWIGGNNVIPTKNACNPTLTSMCFAIRGANALIRDLGKL